jgi:hypothetical protein
MMQMHRSHAPFVLAGLMCAAVHGPATADGFHIDPTAVDTALLAGIQDAVAPIATADTQAPTTLAAADDASVAIDALVAFDFHGTTLGILDIGVNWCVADGVSVGVFGEVITAAQDSADGSGSGDGSAWGGGGGALVRWHFIREERFTMFVDVGCGLLLSNNDIPEGGSAVNFTPRADVGGMWLMSEGVALSARVGWFHVSNAQTDEANPGLDTLAIGLGLSFDF